MKNSSIAIVGAGRVGRALGHRLRQLGWNIGAVVTRSRATARSAVRAIGGGHPQAGLTRRVLDADFVLIATPDRAVAEVAASLAEIGATEWRGKIVLHTSGALDRTPLNALQKFGAHTGSLHPLQAFIGRGEPPLDGIVFAIEGDRRALFAARQVARALGGVPVRIRGSAKPAYHAACVMSAGHLVALAEGSVRILMRLGFSRRNARMALLSLARQSLENYSRVGARKAWTGPVAREDFSTVARHRHALEEFPPEFFGAYSALARLSARVVAARPERTLKKLNDALSES